MTSVAEQTELASKHVHAIGAGGLQRAAYSADFTVWSGLSGMMKGDDFLPRLSVLKQIFTEPLTMTIDTITAQLGRVALQCRSNGLLFNGQRYTNDYMVVVEFDEFGKIRHVREYFDARRAQEILAPAMREWMARQQSR